MAIKRGSYKSYPAGGRGDTRGIPIEFQVASQGTAAGSKFSLAHKTALVLVFDTKCGVCADNMPRWLDMINELREQAPSVPVFAISTDTSRTAPLEFWRGLENIVALVIPESRRQALSVLGARGTPYTAAVRDGRVVAGHLGTVGDWRRSYILRKLEKE
jgi:hypothetical protein